VPKCQRATINKTTRGGYHGPAHIGFYAEQRKADSRSERISKREGLCRRREFADKLYARMGRRSIAPEKLLRALLLQVFYTVRSERLLMEE
jgi:hypothetical protein